MSELEMQEIVNKIEAMDEEQMKLAVKVLPLELLIDEVGRRTKLMKKIIKNSRKALSGDCYDEELE